MDGDCLINYAVWLIVSGRLHSVDSVRNYLSAVRTLCHMFGFDCPTPSSHWQLEWTLVGIRRELQFPPRRKKPITPVILKVLLTFPSNMHNPSNKLSWEEQVLFATIQVVYCLAFFSMLRGSNLMPGSLKKVDTRRILTWDKIRQFPGGVVCSTFLSKTIQYSQKVHEISLAERPGSIFCPVSSLRRLVQLRGRRNCSPNDIVLQIPVNGVWRPLCKATVIKVMRMQLSKMGYNPDDFAFHSFRHGGVQEAVRAQPSLELVKLQSGHVSDAVHTYTNMSGETRMVTVEKMLESLDNQFPGHQ